MNVLFEKHLETLTAKRPGAIVMRWIALPLACLLITTATWAKPRQDDHIDIERVRKDPDFHIQGEYTSDTWGAHVMALGHGKFSAMLFKGGLPGAGWDEQSVINLTGRRDEDDATAAALRSDDTILRITGEMAAFTHGDDDTTVTLKRVARVSPHEGAPPPEGAVVLFDGTGVDAFLDGASMDENRLLTQGAVSREHFGDHRVHLEYFLPFMPEHRDMQRGNSGIYLQGRYEVQIIDSFGMPATPRLNGGIYNLVASREPASYPPMRWQTLQIDFTAPRFNDQGEKTADAKITVRHNGVLIHEDVAVPAPTNAARFRNEAPTGPVYLQNHRNPVRFRNVWVQPGDNE